MPLMSVDFPDLIAACGLTVHTMAGWQSHGDRADHAAVVLHHTASPASAQPIDDAAAGHHGSPIAPVYNVLVDRYGEVWVLARNKANSSGRISGTALAEATSGRANLTPARDRGLHDDTTGNAKLFAISGQNDGVGELWSEEMVGAMCRCAAAALLCIGLDRAGYVTTHRALTPRKIDPCGPGAPDDWHALITTLLDDIGRKRAST